MSRTNHPLIALSIGFNFDFKGTPKHNVWLLIGTRRYSLLRLFSNENRTKTV